MEIREVGLVRTRIGSGVKTGGRFMTKGRTHLPTVKPKAKGPGRKWSLILLLRIYKMCRFNTRGTGISQKQQKKRKERERKG